jgi:D-serine deaminase-like pyridoxal phosphate-dependent protein
MLAVGHPREAELLAEAALAHGVRLDVLVDLDVGDHRTGIAPGPAQPEHICKVICHLYQLSAHYGHSYKKEFF